MGGCHGRYGRLGYNWDWREAVKPCDLCGVKRPVKPLVVPSPFHVVVRKKDPELLEKILSEGGNPNTYNQQGYSPLHLACEMGRADLTRLLCEGGAKVDAPTETSGGNITPLIIAATHGHTECVSILLQAGADVNSVDMWSNTALFKATSASFGECVRILLDNGADPNLANKWGATPLQYACMLGDIDTVRALLKKDCDVSGRGESKSPPPLLAASSRGYTDCVQTLLQYGASPDASDDTDYMPAFSCCQDRCRNMVFNTLREVVYKSEVWDGYAVLNCADLLVAAGCDMRSCLGDIAIYMQKKPVFYGDTLRYVDLYIQKYIFIFTRFSLTCIEKFEQVTINMCCMRLSKINDWRIYQAFISAGGVPTLEHLALMKGDADFNTHEEILLSLENVARNPRSLKHLCRIKVRESLSFNIWHLVSTLHIPELLKDYVCISSPLHYEA